MLHVCIQNHMFALEANVFSIRSKTPEPIQLWARFFCDVLYQNKELLMLLHL